MSSSDYDKEDTSAENNLKFAETDEYVIFGTPIELKEEEIETGKKVLRVEDQVATDDKGRRRFHGAFTGGFSAGYFNTCGSKEGWAPTSFTSSRTERVQNSQLNPEFFMDQEDFSEYGIAPKKYSAKSKFLQSKGQVVNEVDQSLHKHIALRSLISDEYFNDNFNIISKTTIGFELLKKMGWKEGRGVGEKISLAISSNKVYGCELPSHLVKKNEIYVCPQEQKVKIPSSKSNLFGIGYKSLRVEGESLRSSNDKNVSFKPTGGEKKGIIGTAYGIGVYDEHDKEDEIYDNETLENYDFSIDFDDETTENTLQSAHHRTWYGFVIPNEKFELNNQQYNLPILPDGFVPQPVLGPGLNEILSTNNRVTFDSHQRAQLLSDCHSKIKKDNSDYKNSNEPRQIAMMTDLKKKFVSGGHVKNDVIEACSSNTPDISANKNPMRTIDDWAPSELVCRRFNVVYTGRKDLSVNKSTKKTVIDKSLAYRGQNFVEKVGPLSILNAESVQIRSQVPPTHMVDFPINQPVALTTKITPVETEKPSIDFFKAVFCDGDDESNEKSLKRSTTNFFVDSKKTKT